MAIVNETFVKKTLAGADPVTLASATALLATIGFIASYLPARRASKTDPMQVLRGD